MTDMAYRMIGKGKQEHCCHLVEDISLAQDVNGRAQDINGRAQEIQVCRAFRTWR